MSLQVYLFQLSRSLFHPFNRLPLWGRALELCSLLKSWKLEFNCQCALAWASKIVPFHPETISIYCPGPNPKPEPFVHSTDPSKFHRVAWIFFFIFQAAVRKSTKNIDKELRITIYESSQIYIKGKTTTNTNIEVNIRTKTYVLCLFYNVPSC